MGMTEENLEIKKLKNLKKHRKNKLVITGIQTLDFENSFWYYLNLRPQPRNQSTNQLGH